MKFGELNLKAVPGLAGRVSNEVKGACAHVTHTIRENFTRHGILYDT
jgi:hypothetical protein